MEPERSIHSVEKVDEGSDRSDHQITIDCAQHKHPTSRKQDGERQQDNLKDGHMMNWQDKFD